MLSREDNELLCRVGRGSPMGELLRQYWMPALPSTELPVPDGPPKKVRLMGEDLVAFRDTRGQVGILPANCPHRGASLFFGRNEECGVWGGGGGGGGGGGDGGGDVGGAGGCNQLPEGPPETPLKEKARGGGFPAPGAQGGGGIQGGPGQAPPAVPAVRDQHAAARA